MVWKRLARTSLHCDKLELNIRRDSVENHDNMEDYPFCIKQLLIIAGPSCAGKTYLINKMQQGEKSNLYAQIGLAYDSSPWVSIQSNEIGCLPEKSFNKLIVHYDFYGIGETPPAKVYSSFLSKLTRYADQTTTLTMYSAPDILLKRLRERIFYRICRYLKDLCTGKMESVKNDHKILIKMLCKRKGYRTGKVAELYSAWFNTLKQLESADHWIIENEQLRHGIPTNEDI